MKKILRIGGRVSFALFATVLLLVGAIGQAMPVSAALPPGPTTLYYDLYATDGFIQMADGTSVYIYGYIGGLRGSALSYLDYPAAVNAAPGGSGALELAHGPAGAPTLNNTDVTIGTPGSLTVQAPTAGGLTTYEAQLLGKAQVPAPVITARVGDIVIITLKNLGVANPIAPNDPHTVHLHGLDVNAANDGVPETSVATIPAWDNVAGADNTTQPGFGNLVVYEFAPTVAATYMYHCHQEADIHVQMGMYGALIVYNARDAQATNGPAQALLSAPGGVQYNWRYNNDIVMLLSEVDVRQHLSEQFAGSGAMLADITAYMSTSPNQAGADITTLGLEYNSSVGFNPATYKPQYWLVNGLSFPDTLHLGGAGGAWGDWILAHPGYDPFISGSASARSKILLRVINLGFETQPMHMHGFHAKIIGMDQRAYTWANPPGMPTGRGMEQNTLLIGSGNTFELLYDFGTQAVAGTYNDGVTPAGSAGVFSRYNVADNTPQLNTAGAFPPIPDPFAVAPLPPDYIGGPSVQNDFVFHNHDDYKATNNGVYPGGQFTMIRVIA